VIAGSGVHHSNSVEDFVRVAERLGAPVTTAWSHDVIASDHPLWCGRQGTIGDRAGNFTVQAADLVLILGSRMAIRQLSYNYAAFAPDAYKIHVDIDPAELAKPTLQTDLQVESDLKDFLELLEAELERRAHEPQRHVEWLAWCRQRVGRYPVVQAHHRTKEPPLNPYHFMESLFERLGSEDVVVTGDGAACIMSFQAGRLTGSQRLFSNSGSASMGYDLPAALGAAVAQAEADSDSSTGTPRRTICLGGDGSLQMNIQELQTLATHAWPLTIFVIDNGGYLSIRTTQTNFFGRLIGESSASGIGFPDWVSLARAYGIEADRIDDPATMGRQLDAALAASGPYLAHVVVDPEQGFEPRVRSRQLPDGTITSPALDDLYPFLSEEEAESNRVRPDGTLP
jgi:acetolactate synthase-1/2/3 large subunit